MSISDASVLVNKLLTEVPYKDNAPFYNGPIPAGWECADISGLAGTPDGELSISDASVMINTLLTQEPYMSNAPFYNGPCLGMAPQPE
jgi:hypothetical protein